MDDGIEIDDVEDALRRAEELADITGRSKADVVADLLDDGQLNYSAGQDAEPKKDLLDIAQEKAEKLKKLMTTVVPILLLLGGVGAEGIGILDVTGWGEDSVWSEDGPGPIWGCTDSNADNYDHNANADDGSCHWDDNHGGGGGPPCSSDWRWENVHIRSEDLNGQGYNNDLEIELDFVDGHNCHQSMEGHFEVRMEKNGNTIEEWDMSDHFTNSVGVSATRMDLPAGDYRIAIDYHYDGSFWEGPSALVTIEDAPQCDSDIVVTQLVLSANGNDLNLYAEFTDNNDCGGEIEMKVGLMLNDEHQGQFLVANNYNVHENGNTYFNINQDNNGLMGDVEDGDWKIEFVWYPIGEDENCCDYTNTVTVDEIPDVLPCAAVADNFQVNVDENTVELDFYLQVDEDTDCPSHLTVEFILRSDSNTITHESEVDTLDSTHSWDFEEVPNGDWAPEIVVRAGEEELDDDELEPITVDFVEICEINLYWVAIATNTTHAQMGYDIDCGNEPNDLDGYNVSVQFLVYEVGSDNATNGSQPQPILWDTRLHYIQGWVEDNHVITLTNFTGSNNTHYDFYGYFTWIDHEGESQMIEHKWLNRELEP